MLEAFRITCTIMVNFAINSHFYFLEKKKKKFSLQENFELNNKTKLKLVFWHSIPKLIKTEYTLPGTRTTILMHYLSGVREYFLKKVFLKKTF